MHREMLQNLQEKNFAGSFGLSLTWNDKIYRENLLQNMNLRLKKGSADSTSTDDGMYIIQNIDLSLLPYKLALFKPNTFPPCNYFVDLMNLTCEEVAEFIKKSNFGDDYAEAAIESEVSGKLLLEMKDKQLRRLLGMKTIVFWKFKVTIMREYQKNQEGTRLARKFDTRRTAEFCGQHDCLRCAIPHIVKHEIDGEMLLTADVDVLKEISSDCEEAKSIINKYLKLV